ncbi:MAG: RpiB/LacA/LacB family sugar-phosphate isomerase [Candidatus Woesearchaeota archaeon]
MKIFIGSDHGGFLAKEYVKKWLLSKGHAVDDVGAFKEESDDYSDYAKKVAKKVVASKALGILICGSGTGMQIAANKVKGIRAAFAYDKYGAVMARKDNDANILTLRGRKFPKKNLLPIVDSFIKTKFSNLPRHKRRISKLEK